MPNINYVNLHFSWSSRLVKEVGPYDWVSSHAVTITALLPILFTLDILPVPYERIKRGCGQVKMIVF